MWGEKGCVSSLLRWEITTACLEVGGSSSGRGGKTEDAERVGGFGSMLS